MGANATRAARLRAALRVELGSCCAWCDGTRSLEFDLVVPVNRLHHRSSALGRLSCYRRQLHLGNLQLLCRECHRCKSAFDAWFLNSLQEYQMGMVD